MTTTLAVASWLLAGGAVVLFVLALALTRDFRGSLALGLDLLLAAGLLRLASAETWAALASAAAIVAVRKLVMWSLSASSGPASVGQRGARGEPMLEG